MFKGIRTFLSFTSLLALISANAFAASDEEIAGKALRACKNLGGSYSVDREDLVEEGDNIKECAKVRCSISSSGAGGVTVDQVKAEFPNASQVGGVIAGWKRSCKTIKRSSDDDFIIDVTGGGSGDGSNSGNGSADGDADWDGGAGGGFYINGRLVTRSEWERECVKRNGKIRSKCSRGRAYYDDYYYDGDGSRRGSGGGRYVLIKRADGSTFRCTYTTSWDHCLGEEGSVIVSVHGDVDTCINCEGGGRRRGNGALSGIAEIAGAILPPLAYLGSNWLWSDAYLGSNQAWAGAAATGFEQCQIMQTNHIQSMYGNGTTSMQGYFANNELPHEYIAPPNCNGYHLGMFAGGMGFMGNGMGGFGSPWMGAGYSPGFMAGMYGPYGQYNPYGSVIGMGGMPGMGMGLGMGIGLGMGMPGMGMPGMGMGLGMGMPGMGMPGMGMGLGMGMPGMGMGLGMGMPGMGNNGLGLGFGLNGGVGAGMPGGGYFGPGGAYSPYGNIGAGATGMGIVPWGNGAGSYWNGTGGWNGNGFGNGFGNQYGANYGNIQQSYALNQQALVQDNYYQQAALQNSYNQAAQNLWSVGYGGGMYGAGMGNYGYAPYSPTNMGLSMNLGWGFGF